MTEEEFRNKDLTQHQRYQLKFGRFGAYIYDSHEHEDIDLQTTVDLLNSREAQRNVKS